MLISQKYYSALLLEFGQENKEKLDTIVKQLNELPNQFRIYRKIYIYDDEYDTFFKRPIGIYWSLHKEKADAYGNFEGIFGDDGDIGIIMEALVEKESINWEKTIELRMNYNEEFDEDEIRLKNGVKIKLLNFFDEEGNNPVKMNKIVKAVSNKTKLGYIKSILIKLCTDEDLSLEFGQNFYGHLDDNIKYRIFKFYQEPNEDNWSDIATIIINPNNMMTVWKAVIKQDPTFPKVGRSKDIKGKVIEDWKRIPTPELVREAIKNSVYGVNLN